MKTGPILVLSRPCHLVMPICGCLLAGSEISNPAGVWISVAIVVCYQVEVSATGRSLVQWSPTDCGVPLSVMKCSFITLHLPRGR